MIYLSFNSAFILLFAFPKMAKKPAFLIAGTHSGVGKTTVSFVIMSLLKNQGFAVQPFKIGPDFIDPGYHRLATERDSLNLDLWMMGIENVKECFDTFSEPADVSVIEGMGALFDGENGLSELGSAAYFAKQLDVPVILVIDIWGMTRSASAVINGFTDFDKDLKIGGLIFNRAGSRKHYEMVLSSLSESSRKITLGFLHQSNLLAIPERHLGLLTTEENPDTQFLLTNVVNAAAETIDIDKLISCFDLGKKNASTKKSEDRKLSRKSIVRIGIARDEAFCFYYKENLLMLERAGAELVPFSPIRDSQLPADLDGLYIGGGYPESFARELSENEQLRHQIKTLAKRGLPILAECGGLMYLCNKIIGFDGEGWDMVSVFPFAVKMDKDYLAIKYVKIKTVADSPLGPENTVARGQEFHQSRIITPSNFANCFELEDSAGHKFKDGFLEKNVLGSYIHLHFRSNPDIPVSMVSKCLDYKKKTP